MVQIKNTVPVINNTFLGLISRLHMAEETANELEEKLMKKKKK